MIAEQARRVPISLLISATLLAALVMPYVPFIIPAAWLILVCGITTIHTRILSALPTNLARSEDKRLTIAAATFGIHGLALAVLIAIFPWVPIAIGAVITIYNVGLCAATLHATAGFRRIYTPYAVITLGPIAIAWSFSPSLHVALYERLVFVGLTLAYLVTMLGHAKGAFAVFTDSYNIRLQRIDLNNKLTAALQEAEIANNAKTQFLASASHDLRQPIHALSLFSGSLLLRDLDPRTSAIAEQIDKAINTLVWQLDALLDISRLDAGVVARSISIVQLEAPLSQLVQEFLPLARAKSLTLSVSCSGDIYVRTDSALLQRILRNLISNAIKYTDRGQIKIEVNLLDDYWRIAVRDTGIGIPASEHKRIFDEFYQFNNPERDRSKGLGLGLAIVRRLAKLLDIRIQLISEPGQGSQFFLDVPNGGGANRAICTTSPDSIMPPGKIQVLVIDDEEIIRLGMKTLIEELGFDVFVCDSTEAAVDAYRSFLPSIVLADFRLRGKDNGLLAIEALRELRPDLPALLISGDTEPARLREAHDAGIELLHKPVASVELKRCILRAIES